MKEDFKLTLNKRNHQSILFQSRDTIVIGPITRHERAAEIESTIVTMSKFVTKNFIVLYLRTAELPDKISKNFLQF